MMYGLSIERQTRKRQILNTEQEPTVAKSGIKNAPIRIRLGMIGIGGYAQTHVRLMTEHPEVDVVALCDTAAAMVKRTKTNFPTLADAPVYGDYRKMIGGEDLDAVTISTPHTLHYEQLMHALDKRLHVLVDKPMVCSAKHAKTVMAKAKKVRRVVLLSYQRHYQGIFRYMRDAVSSGRLGKVEMLAAYNAQDWLRGTKGKWRQDPKLSGGGQLNDTGSHLVDILMWVTGLTAKRVGAFMENFKSKVDINSVVNVEFTNGAIGTITICGNGPRWHEDITIVGSKGALYVRAGKLFHHDRSTGAELEVSGVRDHGTPDSNFVDVVLRGAVNDAVPDCGLRAIQLTEAAWKSRKAGRMITV
jgi:predicted dehydrogenase